MSEKRDVDMVTMSIIDSTMTAICREMGVNVQKTAYSTIFSEAEDFTCALASPEGDMIAVAEFCPAQIGGVPLLRLAAERFLGHPDIDAVSVVIHTDDRALYEVAVAGLGLAEPVDGGPERQDSVRRGLEAMTTNAPQKVLVHDAVRPFVSHAVISGVVAASDMEAAKKRAKRARYPKDILGSARSAQNC